MAAKTFMASLALAVLLATPFTVFAAPEGCGVCHGKERVQHERSVHARGALGCVACHGGDPAEIEDADAAHAADTGFRGTLDRKAVPEACGTCHADVVRMRRFDLRTDVLAAYRTSHHGRAVLVEGRVEAAICTDCHGTHDVFPTSDPRSPAYRMNVPQTCGGCHADEAMMENFGLGTEAPARFAASVHGQRLAEGQPGVPSCADCHDAHAAAPPGAGEVADVCGHCHAETRERFAESPHAAASRAGAMEECVTCHGNHAVSAPGFERFDSTSRDEETDGQRCLDCHTDDAGAEVALAFGAGFRETDEELRKARRQIDAMAAAGYHAEDEREALLRAERELIHAVPLSHAADLPRIQGSLRRARSLIDEALEGREKRLREGRDRRIYGTVVGALLLGIAWFMAIWRSRVRAS